MKSKKPEKTASKAKKSQAKPAPAAAKQPATAEVYQFKITLPGSQPPIWRRIQVPDCSLDKLHSCIQSAMGWDNMHLHQFRIGQEIYGDPGLLGEDGDDFEALDSTATMLSQVVPAGGKGFKFNYEYDFGDSWDHDVLFEGCVAAKPGSKYPCCLEGARACPPEDVGGLWGYSDFLKAIGDKKHPQHAEMVQWIGARFDPAAFDAAAATKSMQREQPSWKHLV